jgi:hypothetical protein
MVHLAIIDEAPDCPQVKEALGLFDKAMSLFSAGAKFGSAKARRNRVKKPDYLSLPLTQCIFRMFFAESVRDYPWSLNRLQPLNPR